MSQYRIRNGIVLLNIQGTYILAADEEARKYCIYAKEINETGAVIWHLLEKEFSDDEIIKYMAENYDIEDLEVLTEDISSYLYSLQKLQYIQSIE